MTQHQKKKDHQVHLELMHYQKDPFKQQKHCDQHSVEPLTRTSFPSKTSTKWKGAKFSTFSRKTFYKIKTI
jgi:hypothetical protein